MNLELYKSFYYVAKLGSISKASEKLYISQPAVSRSIKQLEKELDCSLFIRNFTGVKPTKEGEILYQYVEQVFDIISSAEKKIAEMKSLISGEVRIGSGSALCKHYLQSRFKLFNSHHPSIKINVTNGSTISIIKLLKAGKIDLGVINMHYDDEQLNCKEILELQDCFVVGEKYKHLAQKPQSLTELVKYPILLLGKSSTIRHVIDDYFRQNSVSVVPGYELSNLDLLTSFAKDNFGIACVVSNYIKEELDKGELYEIELIEKIPQRSANAVWMKDVALSIATKELVNYLDHRVI